MPETGLLRVTLSPESHPSLALSCADKVLWLFADQILEQGELAIAYPCLSCRGGLSIFLAYLAIAIEQNPPGRAPDPILVYPGTVEIRQAYTALKVQIGELMDALRQRRVRARTQCYVHPWEANVLSAIRRGRIGTGDTLPLHNFFPAAVLDENGSPRIFAGRDGFGRGDEAPPPLQFATRMARVSSRVRYRAAVIIHDAIESWTERQRLYENAIFIRAGSLIHLFESPYSGAFQKLRIAGTASWRLRSQDFLLSEFPVEADDEIRRMVGALRRVHSVPSLVTLGENRGLAENLRQLRRVANERSEAAAAYSLLHNCYRLILTLPVPTEDFDRVADELGLPSLSERIDNVKEIAETLGPGVAHSLVDESIQVLRSLLDRVKSDPARARALLTEVKRALRDRKRVGIVVSGPTFASAIERFLARELDCEPLSLVDKQIQTVEPRSLPHLEPFDMLVFLSYRAPGVLRWIMSGRAREIVALLTDQERKAAKRDLSTAAWGRDSWRPGATAGSLPAATVTPSDEFDRGPDLHEQRFLQTLETTAPGLPDIPVDDEEFLRDILDYPGVPSGAGTAPGGQSPRACHKLVFRDWYAFVPAEGIVTVLSSPATTEKRVEDVSEGDIILFINGDQRQSIYEIMLAEIKKSPAFALSVDIIQAWHRRLKTEFAASGVTAADLHRELRGAGSDVVGATVRAWLRGSVMSPQDAENLARLFRTLNIPDPDSRYSLRIDQAARHLRNVYRQYAKAVNAFLLRTAGDDRPELDALLEKYNLDIEAIKDAVLALEVESISDETVTLPASMTGRLYDRS